MRPRLLAAFSAPCALLAACNLAPDYEPPKVDMPAHYKEAAGWTRGEPQDDRPRGE